MPHRPPPVRRAVLGLAGLIVAGVALFTACVPGGPTRFVLGADGSVVVLRGTDAEVIVQLNRLSGADAPVDLTVTGLPADVTASFDPSTLVGGATASTLTITAAAAASETTAALTVTGTAGTVSDEVDVTLTVESLAVQGHVLGPLNQPVIGATVASQGETTFTNANGAFSIDGLSVPYDLVVSSSDGDGGLHVFEGLRSASPVVRPFFGAFDPPTPALGTTVSGALVDGALGVDERVVVCLEGLAFPVYGCDTLVAGDAAYSIGASWFAGSAASVRVQAIHYEVDADDVPTDYLGYMSLPLDLVDGVGSFADLDFDPLAADTLIGTASIPAELPDTGALVSGRFGPNLSVPLVDLDSPGATFEALVPVLPGFTYDVLLFARATPGDDVFTWRRGVGLEAGNLAVAVPAQQVAPADGAVGVDLTTPFSSTAVGGARTYVWLPDTVGPLLALTTARTTVAIPDPALGGLPFPAGATYGWVLLGHGNDGADIAAEGGYADFVDLFIAVSGGGPGVGSDRTLAIPDEDRDFTFAP